MWKSIWSTLTQSDDVYRVTLSESAQSANLVRLELCRFWPQLIQTPADSCSISDTIYPLDSFLILSFSPILELPNLVVNKTTIDFQGNMNVILNWHNFVLLSRLLAFQVLVFEVVVLVNTSGYICQFMRTLVILLAIGCFFQNLWFLLDFSLGRIRG